MDARFVRCTRGFVKTGLFCKMEASDHYRLLFPMYGVGDYEALRPARYHLEIYLLRVPRDANEGSRHGGVLLYLHAGFFVSRSKISSPSTIH